MERDCTKATGNVYFEARKNAAKYNDRLSSREGAAELLGVSVSTLADYELGVTKIVPVDKVVLMADLYNRPELKALYCKCECPIGLDMPIATKIGMLESVALKLVKEFEPKRLAELQHRTVEIALDGKVDESEKAELAALLDEMDGIALVLSELRLLGEKALKSKGD